MIDGYSHNDSTVFYISESIPGPLEYSIEYSNLIQNYNSQITHSCSCVEMCSYECACIQLCNINYTSIKTSTNNTINKNNELKDLQNTHIVECNDLCTCTEMCSNRVVQKGPIKNLSVKTCSNAAKGYGLFTNTFIPEGTFICEYAGEIITRNEAEKRHSFNGSRQKMNYIFCLNEVVDNETIQTFIDPSVFGNIGRYINHSCNPNSIVMPVRINCPIPKLAIFSSCNIHPGTEITFHYGIDNLRCPVTKDMISQKLCLCQSPQCNSTMPFNPY